MENWKLVCYLKASGLLEKKHVMGAVQLVLVMLLCALLVTRRCYQDYVCGLCMSVCELYTYAKGY